MPGTIYDRINLILGDTPIYKAFRRGEIGVAKYQQWIEIESHNTQAVQQLNEDQLNLSGRTPVNKQEFVQRALSQCMAHDIIADDHFDAGEVRKELTRIDSGYDHGGFSTYIFPGENDVLYAIVRKTRPGRAVFMGSYYGYRAAMAKAAHPTMELALVDINTVVMARASENFARLGLAGGTRFVTGDAETFAGELEELDLAVLDAEGPKSEDVPEDYRDKAIYYPHLRAMLDKLRSGAIVIAHNVILSNFSGSGYFSKKQENYRQQYSKFLPLFKTGFAYTIIDSTEGMLVARKS
ncbi:hypothetical protein O1611_g5545 [Lasiodiplodia mahajangana]|uniref:Uncharacterized protein n=1 Tax=Lasiodiplodia mahajangana TaxID=1108764 RepID=A0ACC2JKQ2_9PEZI|nr:hypothetical protein O1611_g5545 [Lasiodiplodia mahajangana]